MFHYLFKAFWLIPLVIILMANSAVIMMIVKDVGLKQPYTWLIIIGAIAYIADQYLYGKTP